MGVFNNRKHLVELAGNSLNKIAIEDRKIIMEPITAIT
jgi:hypothetical protein